MRRTRIAACFSALLLLSAEGSGVGAAETTETTALDQLNGRCLEHLNGWNGDFELSLRGGFLLAYRQNAQHKIFLLTLDALRDKRCATIKGHVIVSALLLPTIGKDEWFAVSLDCFDPSHTVCHGRPIIGIFSKADNSIPTPTLKAWRVDRGADAFRPVERVACRSFD